MLVLERDFTKHKLFPKHDKVHSAQQSEYLGLVSHAWGRIHNGSAQVAGVTEWPVPKTTETGAVFPWIHKLLLQVY